MYPTSDRFRESVRGTHEAVCRVQLLLPGDARQFGVAPQRGYEMPVLSGSVKMALDADVKRDVSVVVPGEWWDFVQPYGAELFVERGIDFGDGTRELVPLGYYRIEQVEQDSAPDGPITITASDRVVWIMSNRVLFPYQVPNGTSHNSIFQRLINGVGGGYPALPFATTPISFPDYNATTTTITGGAVIEDSTYEWLAEAADSQGCVLRFTDGGELEISKRYLSAGGPAVLDLAPGDTGTILRSKRGVTRDGVYNIVSAYGSDPATPTGYSLAYNEDTNSVLYWSGLFGTVPRYYASPLIRTGPQAASAAASVLSRYTGLPSSLTLDLVPDPSIRPGDVANVRLTEGGAVQVHQLDTLDLPLTGDGALIATTRTVQVP